MARSRGTAGGGVNLPPDVTLAAKMLRFPVHKFPAAGGSGTKKLSPKDVRGPATPSKNKGRSGK